MARFTSSDGLSLYYEDEGAGRAVLCLAGLTRNARDFDPLAPHLRDLRMLRLDYRGRGHSDHDPDFTNYNILREAQDVIELLDHLGLERVTLIGTSRGGLIAMELAAVHAARLEAVLLNDIGPEVAPGGLERIMDYVGKPPPFEDLDAAAAALEAAHRLDFPGVERARWRAQAEAMFAPRPHGGLALRYDPRLRDALVGQAGAGEAVDLWALFDALDATPLAVVRGANSDLLSAETLARMQANHPALIAATVPDRGHVPFLDEPQALAALRELLETCAK